MALRSLPEIKEVYYTETTETNKLVDYGQRVWKRALTLILILLTILTALAINNLVNTFLHYLSPEKEKIGILTLIISQTLYALVLSVLLIVMIVILNRQAAQTSTSTTPSAVTQTDNRKQEDLVSV